MLHQSISKVGRKAALKGTCRSSGEQEVLSASAAVLLKTSGYSLVLPTSTIILKILNNIIYYIHIF